MNCNFLIFLVSIFVFVSCTESEDKKEKTNSSEPAFCDCVNKDYHNDGDKEKCDKIEKELTLKLQSANQEEKGDILMKIQDCKVQGQYDND
jgi:hypothetical protein